MSTRSRTALEVASGAELDSIILEDDDDYDEEDDVYEPLDGDETFRSLVVTGSSASFPQVVESSQSEDASNVSLPAAPPALLAEPVFALPVTVLPSPPPISLLPEVSSTSVFLSALPVGALPPGNASANPIALGNASANPIMLRQTLLFQHCQIY
jgi:hypothetical protein